MKLEDVYVAFGGDTKDLRRELKSLDASMRESQAVSANALRSIQGSFDAVRDGLGALGVALSAGAIVTGVTSIIQRMDDLADTAQMLSVSAESLQVFRLAAEANGASAEIMDKGLRDLVKTIGEARDGSQEAAKAFRELGLDDLVARGGSVEDVMLAAADAIAKIDDPTLKAQAAIALFGKSGLDLVSTLSQGSTELRRFGDEARNTGQVVNDQTVAQLAAAQDTINQATTAIGNFATVALANVINFATESLKGLVWFVRQVNGLMGGVNVPDNPEIDDRMLAIPVDQLKSSIDLLERRIPQLKRSLQMQMAAGLGDVVTNDTKATIEKLERQLSVAKGAWSKQIVEGFAGSEGPPPPPKRPPVPLAPPTPRPVVGGGKPRKSQARIGENDQPDFEFELLRDAAQELESYNQGIDRLAETMRDRFGPEQDKLAEAQANLNTLLREGRIDTDEYAKMLARAKETIGSAKDWIDEAFDSAADAIGAAVTRTKDWDDALQDVGQSLLQLAQQELILKPLKESLSGIFGALRKDAGGVFADILDGIGIFGRAGGGPVNAGQPYLVGESGPEWFVPPMSGRIARGGAGGGSMNITVDLRGTSGDDAIDRKVLAGVKAAVAISRRDSAANFGPMLQRHQLRSL